MGNQENLGEELFYINGAYYTKKGLESVYGGLYAAGKDDEAYICVVTSLIEKTGVEPWQEDAHDILYPLLKEEINAQPIHSDVQTKCSSQIPIVQSV